MTGHGPSWGCADVGGFCLRGGRSTMGPRRTRPRNAGGSGSDGERIACQWTFPWSFRGLCPRERPRTATVGVPVDARERPPIGAFPQVKACGGRSVRYPTKVGRGRSRAGRSRGADRERPSPCARNDSGVTPRRCRTVSRRPSQRRRQPRDRPAGTLPRAGRRCVSACAWRRPGRAAPRSQGAPRRSWR